MAKEDSLSYVVGPQAYGAKERNVKQTWIASSNSTV